MGYKLVPYNGDTVAVPQLVFTHLTQADGDTIRAALYILQTGDTDPRTMARALGLPSIEAAKRALQYWAGAGLLENERGGSPAPAAEPRHADLACMANDPYVAVLSQESQTIFGKGISRNELQRLVDLYQIDGWKPDVILLCCAEVARLGRRTVGASLRRLSICFLARSRSSDAALAAWLASLPPLTAPARRQPAKTVPSAARHLSQSPSASQWQRLPTRAASSCMTAV